MMSIKDPAVVQAAELIHSACSGDCVAPHKHLPVAAEIVDRITSTALEARISQAHTLGIRAGQYASERTVKKLRDELHQMRIRAVSS
jgi:hypothetical protein